MKKITLLSVFLLGQMLLSPAYAMQDQGLNSIISIIDKALSQFQQSVDQQKGNNLNEEEALKAAAATSATIMNLSQTLGNLSYSRLQCGQAEVLAEFTARVQQVPEGLRDQMRDAFQQGFDKSKEATPLLSEDECKRLTESRNLGEKKIEANVEEVPEKPQPKKEEKPKVVEDPKLKHLRVAELTGQLAYRRKFCGDKKVVTRDFNEVIGSMPEAVREQAKAAYWKGYKHGKRLNVNFTEDKCFKG